MVGSRSVAHELRSAVSALGPRGLDLGAMRIELDHILRRWVGYDVAAISTLDPATRVWTSCFLSGLAEDPDRETAIFELEFAGIGPNTYAELADRQPPVARLRATVGDDLRGVARYNRALAGFGVVDELRAVLHSQAVPWGTLTLYRQQGSPLFSDADEHAIAAASGPIGDLFRLTLLRAALDAPDSVERPPGVLVVEADGTIISTTAAATRWLQRLDDRHRLPSAIRNVAAATLSGAGLAQASLPLHDGSWVMLHGSTVERVSEPAQGDHVVVVIEGARPSVLSEVIAGAYGFTPREREITVLVAQGRTTKQMANQLNISPFTVSDHLKAIFAKADVQSRGELVAALYSRHYQAHFDAGHVPGPYGWYLDDAIKPAS